MDSTANIHNERALQNHELQKSFMAALTPQGENAPEMICQLGKLFYDLGWASGTGGGISIKNGKYIFVAPSGVQKERLNPEDIFMISNDGSVLISPAEHRCLKMSQCTPLFLAAYNLCDAGAVVHSHSKHAVLVTLLTPEKEFRISHLEMIKGIRHPKENRAMRYDEELVVPIIENTAFEADLKDSMEQAIKDYPNACAVLVRRHGVYVWGDSWIKAKTMAESYDYLFSIAVEMKKLNIPLVSEKK